MRGIAAEFSALGVTEIARTVCELLDWKRPNGGLKNHECRQLLERLAAEGALALPSLRKLGGRGPRRADVSGPSCHPAPIECAASECEPLELILVEGKAESRRWREQMERHHYLGCRVPFGANLRYWVRNGNRELACLLWTSPGLEDAGPRRLDRVERRAAATESAIDRQQWPIPHPAMGASQRTGQQDSGAECTDRATRLGGPIWAASAAIGNTGGRGPLSRNLLPGRQLDPCWADHWARAYGSRAPKTRCAAFKDIYIYPLIHDVQHRLCSDPAR